MTLDLRLPPFSLESEQAVIGALLTQPHAFDRIDWLQASAFYREDHRLIYAALRAMIEAGRPVDVLLLCEHMGARGELEKVGGMVYIGSLAINTPSAHNIHRYAAVVRDKALLRGLIAHASEIVEAASAVGADPRELAERADASLYSVIQQEQQSESATFMQAMDEALLSRKNAHLGIATGFVDLDAMLGLLKGGDFVVIAGRPSMGKTSLATCIAEHVAGSKPIAFMSMEMARHAIANRIMHWHERNADIDSIVEKLHTLQLHIETPPTLSIGSMRLKLRRQKRKHGLAMAVVDYLGLMRGEGENRTQEIGSISRGLKSLAVEFDIPVVAVCQLNRAPENRADKRPLLSELRESGDIEQDADIVLMVYRDDYYNQQSEARGTAEIIIRKHRNGPTGMVRLAFILDYVRFENYAGPPIINATVAPVRSRNVTDFRK